MSVLLVDPTPIDLRIGVLSGDEVTQLHHEVFARGEPRLGALYRAKVHTQEPRLGGVFCDLGVAQGFLPAQGRPPPNGSVLTVGVKREAIGDKAVQLAQRPALRLPGATVRESEDGLVIAPGPLPVPEGEKGRTKAEARRLGALAFGGVATVGAVVAMPPILRAVTALLSREVAELRVGDPDAAAMLRANLAPLGIAVHLHEPVGLRAVLDTAEAAALERTASLPGGGRIVIDEAEALTAIDVDLGRQEGRSQKGASERAFSQSLPVLGLQAKLRSLGGQIVLDLPRRAAPSPKILRDRLTKAFAPLGRVSIPAATGEGICVVIAPRPTPSLLERLTEAADGPVRPGRRLRADVLAGRAYRALEEALLSDRSQTVTLACPERARAHLGEDALAALVARYGARFDTESHASEVPHVR